MESQAEDSYATRVGVGLREALPMRNRPESGQFFGMRRQFPPAIPRPRMSFFARDGFLWALVAPIGRSMSNDDPGRLRQSTKKKSSKLDHSVRHTAIIGTCLETGQLFLRRGELSYTIPKHFLAGN